MQKRTDKKDNITSFEKVNEALKQIALNESLIENRTSIMNKKMIEIKEKYQPDIEIAEAENKQLEKDIEKFLKKNKSVFENVKSKVLTFGRVGFQLGKKHLDRQKKYTWETITENFFNIFGSKYVTVKKVLNKDAVIEAIEKGELEISDVIETGADVVQNNRAFYKISKSLINSEKDEKE